MKNHKIEHLQWLEVMVQRPYQMETVWETLTHIATLSPRGAVVWEARGRSGHVTHLLGADRNYIGKIKEVFRAHGDVQFRNVAARDRQPVSMARTLKISHPQLSLNTDITESAIRAGLAALSEDKSGRDVVLQAVLGRGFAPSPVSPDLQDPTASWLEVITGCVSKATAEARKSVREKAEQDILSASLLTLTEIDGASLLWLQPLLTDKGFRQKIVRQVKDKVGLMSFWNEFEALSDLQRQQWIAPVSNKLRQFTLRPWLRNVFGQAHPKFDLSELFIKRKIVLVPLNKGLVGGETARLLGSLIVGLTWTLALSRASIPPERRHIVSVYIDELQDYLSLPTDLSDALAQARGLGVGMTLAHQYRDQLPTEVRAGIDANCRNKIAFGLNAKDAKDMAAMAPELTSEDFMTLPRYRVYTSFQQSGKASNFFNENSFTFEGSVLNGQMQEIADYIRAKIEECKKQKSGQRAAVSAADELKKFKDLLDMGVITQEEFDAKKKQLLGL